MHTINHPFACPVNHYRSNCASWLHESKFSGPALKRFAQLWRTKLAWLETPVAIAFGTALAEFFLPGAGQLIKAVSAALFSGAFFSLMHANPYSAASPLSRKVIAITLLTALDAYVVNTFWNQPFFAVLVASFTALISLLHIRINDSDASFLNMGRKIRGSQLLSGLAGITGLAVLWALPFPDSIKYSMFIPMMFWGGRDLTVELANLRRDLENNKASFSPEHRVNTGRITNLMSGIINFVEFMKSIQNTNNRGSGGLNKIYISLGGGLLNEEILAKSEQIGYAIFIENDPGNFELHQIVCDILRNSDAFDEIRKKFSKAFPYDKDEAGDYIFYEWFQTNNPEQIKLLNRIRDMYMQGRIIFLHLSSLDTNSFEHIQSWMDSNNVLTDTINIADSEEESKESGDHDAFIHILKLLINGNRDVRVIPGVRGWLRDLEEEMFYPPSIGRA